MATAQEKQFARLMAELSREETREELALLVSDPPAPPDFLDRDFQAQVDFIEDPSRLKLALCTRRAGKSYGDGLYLFKTAYENPRCTVVYFGLTRLTAKFVMWRPVLDRINREFGLNAKPNLSDLSWELPNGSVIYLLGVDSNEDEMRKAFGQKFKLVVVDEAALYRIDLKSLVYSVLQPATADEQGTICLTGMPSNLKRGLFFQLTQERQEDGERKFVFDWLEPKKRWKVVDRENGAEWSGHFWTAFDNPHMREQWKKEIDEKKRNNPRIEETPFFQQEYLGQWVVDRDKWVYKYDADRNTFYDLPEYAQGDWHYILGIDLGYEDDTAFCVMAYHENDPTAYVVEAWGEPKLDITDVVGHIKSAMIRYPGIGDIVVDGSNKQAVEEMRRRHDLWFMSSVQKKYKVGNSRPAKANMIEVMNADFIMGRIKIHPEKCKSLIDEYENLIWDDRKDGLGPRQEHPGCANHNCFVAGTLVRTEDGERPIESLRAGDLVWTREGLRPVAARWVSGVEPIWTLHTTAGTLRGTHDHPIWTQDGWKPLSALTQHDTLVSWASTDLPRPSFTMASPTGDTPSQTCARSASTTRRSEANDCTGCCTKKHTACSYRAPHTSTTSTAIRSTTTCRTSKRSTDASTSASTCSSPRTSRSHERASRSPSSTPPSGTAPRKGGPGTGRTGGRRWRRAPSSIACARCAASRFSRSSPTPRCAARSAEQRTGARAGSTTSTSCAPSAASSSGAASSASLGAAAPCRVLAVTPPQKDSHREPVHAVSVEGVHEYFANDVLVSNCDSAFYSWLSVYSYLSEIAETPPAVGTPAWQDREIAALEARDAQRMERQIVGARNAMFDDYDDGYSVIDVTEFFDA